MGDERALNFVEKNFYNHQVDKGYSAAPESYYVEPEQMNVSAIPIEHTPAGVTREIIYRN